MLVRLQYRLRLSHSLPQLFSLYLPWVVTISVNQGAAGGDYNQTNSLHRRHVGRFRNSKGMMARGCCITVSHRLIKHWTFPFSFQMTITSKIHSLMKTSPHSTVRAASRCCMIYLELLLFRRDRRTTVLLSGFRHLFSVRHELSPRRLLALTGTDCQREMSYS